MPRRIVSEHRLIYRNYFMVPTLRNMKQAMELRVFDDDGGGFQGRHINIDLNGKQPHNIIGATAIVNDGNDVVHAHIQMNERILSLDKPKQKMYLAHEWIHAMLGFRAILKEGKSKLLKHISGKEEMVALFHSLQRRSYWRDDDDFRKEMHKALRELLVSNDSIYEMVEVDFNLKLGDIKKQLDADPSAAFPTIAKIANAFAGKWSVDEDLVFDRLQELLFPVAASDNPSAT